MFAIVLGSLTDPSASAAAASGGGLDAGRAAGGAAIWYMAVPRWSPSPHGPIRTFLVNPDGSGRRQLYAGRFCGRHFAHSLLSDPPTEAGHWSARYSNGIWVCSPDGKRLRRVTPPSRYFQAERGWALSPDEKRIAYVSGTSLLIVNRDGRDRHRILDMGKLSATSVVWSPDGRWLALACNVRGDQPGGPFYTPSSTLQIIRADGSGHRIIGDIPFYDAEDAAPTWSPDSQTVFYLGRPRPRPVYAGNVLKGTRKRLPYRWVPTFSPDGRHMLYIGKHGVYIADSSGGNPRLLVRPDGDWFPSTLKPVWAPDGRSIAYYGPDSSSAVGTAIWTITPDGRQRRRVIGVYMDLPRLGWVQQR